MAIQTNLYDYGIYFALQFKDVTTLILSPVNQILEPMNWDKMVNILSRDSSYYAFWSDFLEDKYGLTFTFINQQGEENSGVGLSGGGQFLKDIYDQYGDQAEIYFSIGYSNKQGLPSKQIKNWRVNLQEYELLDGSDIAPFGGIMTSIEKMPFQGKLKARMNTPCTVNQYTGMDGELLTPISPFTLRLHSKTLEEQSIGFSQIPQVSNEITSTLGDYQIVQPDQSNLVTNELDGVFSQPLGIIEANYGDSTSGVPLDPNTHGYSGHPFDQQINNFTPVFNGLLDVSYNGSCLFYWVKFDISIIDLWWGVTPRLIQQRRIAGNWTVIKVICGTTQIVTSGHGVSPAPVFPIVSTFPAPNLNLASNQYILPSTGDAGTRANACALVSYQWNEDFSLQVQSGDLIYVHLVMCPSQSPLATTLPPPGSNAQGLQIDKYINTITYSQQTTAPSTTANSYRAFDIINQQLENITGQKNALKSNYFSFGGKGYNYLFANGYSIRNFASVIYQPKKSLQALVDSLQATLCLAAGIQEINGVEYFFLEEITFIFKNLIISTFLNTFNCKEKHNQEWCFNKAEFGYSNWQGINYIMEDEFNTQAKYLLQFLKYGDNLLSKLSELIASGYLLEEQRRNQFNLNSNQSVQNDADWFIVPTSEPSLFTNVNAQGDNLLSFQPLVASNKTIPVLTFIQIMALLEGDVVQITTGGVSYNLTIQSSVTGYPTLDSDAYIIGGNSETWVSGTPYLKNQIVFDAGFNALFIANNNVTSATPPHLDIVNWLSLFFLSSTNCAVIPPSPNQVFAERNQPFQKCTGVIDSSTIYGGRLSPKHILYNWRPILGIGLHFIKPTSREYSVSKIITTEVKMNSRFTSQFIYGSNENTGTLVINEFENESISKYLSIRNNLFTPIELSCDVKAGWNEFDTLRKALSGELGNRYVDFGGVVLKDAAGQFWFCHVMKIKYNIVSEILSLTCQKVSQVLRSGAVRESFPTEYFVMEDGTTPFITESGGHLFLPE